MGHNRLRVLISAPYFQPAVDRFAGPFEAAGIEVILPPVKERMEDTELMTYAGQVDGVISGDDQFTRDVLESYAPRLKVISKWGTGVDSIDLESAERLGVSVRNSPGAFTDAVADTVMGYVLSFARQLPWSHRLVAAGIWTKLPAMALHETTLGVVGVGRIGSAVARRAKGFGMRVLGNDIRELPDGLIAELGIELTDLDELLGRSDFVSLNCDLNPSSRKLIDERRLALMRSTAVLINTARGGVVDEAGLVAALRDGHIGGAALDVFEQEPLSADSPLNQMENVMLAPHNANSSPAAREKVHRNTVQNLFEGLGLPEPNLEQVGL